jgi:hypothetical protein
MEDAGNLHRNTENEEIEREDMELSQIAETMKESGER